MPFTDGEIKGSMICSQAVVERILQDESVTSVKLYNDLQSDNFVSGSSGWQIRRNTGSVEFQDATIRGSLNASDISAGTMSANYISGGTIDATNVTVTNLNATNITSGTLAAARIAANSLSVDKISGGSYGNSDITFSSGSDLISSNYSDTPGSEDGWRINGNGNAWFNDVTVRGSLNTSTIDGDITINGSGGTLYSGVTTGQHIRIWGGNPDNLFWYNGATNYATLGMDASNNIELTTNVSNDITVEASGDLILGTGGFPRITMGATRADASGSNSFSLNYSSVNQESAPTYSFESDTDTGMYRTDTDKIGFSAGGTERFVISTTYLSSPAGVGAAAMAHAVGSVSSPAFTFNSDADTGMYRATADEIGLCAGGAEMFTGLDSTTAEVRILPAYNNTASGDATVGVTSTGLLRRQTSAAKYKTRIKPAPYLADVVLRPVEYWTKPIGATRPEDEQPQHLFGLIADEIAEQQPDAARFGPDGVEDFHDRAVLAVLAAKINRLEAAVGI